MLFAHRRAASALSIGTLFLLASCSGGGGGSGSVPATQPISPQSVHAASAAANSAPAPCTTQPVKTIQATALTPSPIIAGSSATFTVCTQYFGTFKASGYDNTIVSVTITPSTPVDDTIYTATVTVNGLKAGSTSITMTDRKGHSVVVAVTVTPTSQTFASTGAPQQFTVPTGVTQITVDAVGASGGSFVSSLPTVNNAGGLGAEVIAILPVTAGETLNVNVGGVGDFTTPGFNGGGQGALGGGGASDVREAGTALANRIIVAGGGGGVDNANCTAFGGNAGTPNGGTGGSGCGQGTGGGGATQSEGGAGGVSVQTQNSTNGLNGELGLGGEGGIYGGAVLNGGGGGGGYYGGGGGGQDSGGGGGSSWVESSAVAGSVSYKQATQAECDSRGDGCITINW